MKSVKKWFICCILVVLSGADTVNGGSFDMTTSHSPLYFSLVPKKNVDQQISELTPLLKLLEDQLNRPVITVHPHSYQSVIEGLLSQTIDLAILGPAAYAKARARDEGIEAFAAFARKKGVVTPRGSFYYSVLFTLKDQGNMTVSVLKGKRIALTDPASTSGSVIPHRAFSRVIGAPLTDFFGTLIYTGSHDRSIQTVINNDVEAAFVSSARIDEFIEKNQLSPDQVVVLWRSEPIHSDPFVFSSRLDSALKDRIRQIVLSGSPRLSGMLEAMQLVDIVPVSDADYQPIHDIVAERDLDN
jgi:phosphonate transport system substrate-binding protein